MMAHGDLREMDFLARARNTLGATEDDLPAGAFLAARSLFYFVCPWTSVTPPMIYGSAGPTG
jgi:hypothetical protein